MTRSPATPAKTLLTIAVLSLAACALRTWQPTSTAPSVLTQAQYECERDNRLAGFDGINTRFYRHCMAAHGWEPQP